MPKKKTYEKFNEEVNEVGKGEYTVEPPYINSKIKMHFKHLVCGREFDMKPNAFLNGSRCPMCGREHSAKLRTKSMDDFVSEVNKCYGGGKYRVIGKYIDADTSIKVEHLECGNVYNSRPADLIRGHGCPICAYKTRSSKIGVNQRTPLFKVKKSINNILGPDYEVMIADVDYTGNRQSIPIKHSVCGQTYMQKYRDIKQAGVGCPYCSGSSSEQKILQILNKFTTLTEGKDFYVRHRIEGLKDTKHKSMHLDFYFPEYSFAIEYDGKQHYFPLTNFGGIDSFKQVRKNDTFKNKYCYDNDILLFRIPYTLFSYVDLKNYVLEIINYLISGAIK